LTITDPGQDVYDFTAATAELSDLSRLSGNIYHAVSDALDARTVARLGIVINQANGRISSAAQTATLSLAAGRDLEGLAFCAPRGTWFVSDEGETPGGGRVRKQRLQDDALLQKLAIPSPLTNHRANLGLESCTWGIGTLWTANEEALAQESAPSGAASGSVVRLHRFNHRLQPAGQWAYVTDSFGYDSPLTTAEQRSPPLHAPAGQRTVSGCPSGRSAPRPGVSLRPAIPARPGAVGAGP
jgi:hypothetical protein